MPPPELLTETSCAAGFEPPTVPLKVRLVVDSEIAGELTGPTVSVTERFTGELLAPELEIAIVAL